MRTPFCAGLAINPDRPHHKLPYRGAWLWIGPEMIHLMELPNPDPLSGRPEHGGRDRHFCVGVESVEPLAQKLEAAGVAFTKSMSGRPALFFRDPGGSSACVSVCVWGGAATQLQGLPCLFWGPGGGGQQGNEPVGPVGACQVYISNRTRCSIARAAPVSPSPCLPNRRRRTDMNCLECVEVEPWRAGGQPFHRP